MNRTISLPWLHQNSSKRTILVLGLLWLFSLAILTGCASTPTATERWLYNIETNYTPRVELVTNQVPVVVEVLTYKTNEVAGVVTVSTVTNQVVTVSQEIKPVTNWTAQIQYSPGTNAAAVVRTGEAIGAPFGLGGIVGTALSGMIALWGVIRSQRTRKAAAVLVQGIETSRALLRDTPQGQQLDAAFVEWLQKDQDKQKVFAEVATLLQSVRPELAALVAQQLQKAAPAPER